MRARAAFGRALGEVEEAISEADPEGEDLVAALLGDDGRTLADVLLDGDEW